MSEMWLLPIIPIVGVVGMLIAMKFFPIPRDGNDNQIEFEYKWPPTTDAEQRFRRASR